ncbi:hypothetical protein JCGZ_16598 [Jatropha curcas]|uniref:RING-type E3 ubiquitin transferase n=1 Tax=Jatropha curcas TaxID=180498 RepID=A0A067KBQ2_JATCU|nr:RING-H2 finger protein ATL52 [Jatropha curcas]KDP29209.1 hypothetical protein JCGZ_16598 [Jatropha curcas]
MDTSLGPPPPSGSFLSPLLISLAILVGACLLLLTYHFLFVKYCLRRETRLANSISTAIQAGEMSLGVEENVLKSIPILLHSNNKNNHNNFRVDQNECVICLGELQEGEKVRLLPNCRHVFHVPCIDYWFLSHTNCPICRAPIIPPSPPMKDSINSRREITQNLTQSHEHGDEDDGGCSGRNDGGSYDSGGSNGVNVSSSEQALVRHSLSLVLPMEVKKQRFLALKRSLSMDQSFIIINIEREREKGSSASSSSSSSLKGILMENRSYRATSARQIDGVSSRLLRSFSLMRVGQTSLATEILPC